MASRRFWAGLDVGGASTSICVVDQSGAIVQESACPSELAAVDREIDGYGAVDQHASESRQERGPVSPAA